MTLSLTQAKDTFCQLSDSQVKSALMDPANSFIGTIDAGAGNATVLLDSGGTGSIIGTLPDGSPLYQFRTGDLTRVLANKDTVKTIDDTAVGKFLTDPDVNNRLGTIINPPHRYLHRLWTVRRRN